ncbi:MAG: F0F1 ATP synthase subunit epsilon [Candidatus Magasanikbacteria bacterium]|nr:F0F1 ATP synthase subunit epsilon [Candidatus Magasanikbacteria bacterium]
MNKHLNFNVVTAERVVMSEEATQVTIPTSEGEITVLPMHSPLVTILAPGVIEFKKPNGETELAAVSGGFVEVLNDRVVILADTAERAEEIDLARAEEARQKAEAAIQDMQEYDDVKFADFRAVMAREMARTKAAQKWRHLKKVQ